MKQEYAVKLSQFEGPLDLLLYLVNKAEVDIVQIQVSIIAEQYLAYLDLMRDLNIDVAAEYLYMASTLIRLKARELLPPAEGEVMEDEDGIYNKEQLIAQLLEYKKYKEAAVSLRHFEAEQTGCFARGVSERMLIEPATEDDCYIGNITVFDLLASFRKILERAATEGEHFHIVNADNVKIDDRIEHIIGTLDHDEEVRFEDLFGGDCRKIVLVVTFMAILELIKMGEIYFRQEERFGDIFVKRRQKQDTAPAVVEEEIKTEE